MTSASTPLPNHVDAEANFFAGAGSPKFVFMLILANSTRSSFGRRSRDLRIAA